MAKSEKKPGSIIGKVKNLKPRTKQIQPASLEQSPDRRILSDFTVEDAYDPREAWDGEMIEDGPPLELSDADMADLVAKEEANDVAREEVKSSTVLYDNEVNVWRLISKTGNEFLGWTNTVTAMNVNEHGKLGCVVCTKDDNMQKFAISTVYLSDKKVVLRGDKYVITEK